MNSLHRPPPLLYTQLVRDSAADACRALAVNDCVLWINAHDTSTLAHAAVTRALDSAVAARDVTLVLAPALPDAALSARLGSGVTAATGAEEDHDDTRGHLQRGRVPADRRTLAFSCTLGA